MYVYVTFSNRELAWRSGRVMDRHATTQGSIPGSNGVFTELLVLRKGQEMGVPSLKMTLLSMGRWDVKHKQTNKQTFSNQIKFFHIPLSKFAVWSAFRQCYFLIQTASANNLSKQEYTVNYFISSCTQIESRISHENY